MEPSEKTRPVLPYGAYSVGPNFSVSIVIFIGAIIVIVVVSVVLVKVLKTLNAFEKQQNNEKTNQFPSSSYHPNKNWPDPV